MKIQAGLRYWSNWTFPVLDDTHGHRPGQVPGPGPGPGTLVTMDTYVCHHMSDIPLIVITLRIDFAKIIPKNLFCKSSLIACGNCGWWQDTVYTCVMWYSYLIRGETLCFDDHWHRTRTWTTVVCTHKYTCVHFSQSDILPWFVEIGQLANWISNNTCGNLQFH